MPKPHTPFQWAAQAHPDVVDGRLRKLREAINADRKLGRNVGMRYHDGQPSLIEGLLARGDRRVGAVIERVWREGGRFDGWSEHFSYERWTAPAAEELAARASRSSGSPRASATAARGAPVGPPRLRPGARLAVGRLAGRARRPGAGRLPVDAVLRLRRVPVDRHGDRGRAERHHFAAAHARRQNGSGWLTGGSSRPRRGRAGHARVRPAPSLWLEERAGHPVDAPGFEEAFAEWWRVELPRRTFWLAEVGTDRSGFTAIGSINVVEIVHMPRPGARPGRIGHIGNAFVLASFADRGVPAALLNAVVEHAKDRRYRSLLLAPTAGSSAFYRRAGFAPAGGSLLAMDPAQP